MLFRSGFGIGSMCVATHIPALASQVEEFIESIHYQGFIDAELKLDSRDGKFKFIEINSRPGMQIRLTARCGINLPYLAYLDAIGKPCSMKQDPAAEGIKWLSMHSDMKSAYDAIKNKALSLSDYFRSLQGRIEFAIFALDDPLPFIFSLKQTAYAGVKKAWRIIFDGKAK